MKKTTKVMTKTMEELVFNEWAPAKPNQDGRFGADLIGAANLAYQSPVLRDLLVEVAALRANVRALMIDGLPLIVRDHARRIRAAEQKRRKAQGKAKAAKRV